MHPPATWRDPLPSGIRPYLEPAPLAALALGISSGTPLTMVAATLTSRLAQAGIEKKSVTAFSLVLLLYNLKIFWAPLVDRFGGRTTWLTVIGLAAGAAIVALGAVDPRASLGLVVAAALAVGFLGATYDIVIDAYRIELLAPHQLGVGAGMSQYGYRLANAVVAALALILAQRTNWSTAYTACAVFVLPAIGVGLVMGEPPFRRAVAATNGVLAQAAALVAPFVEFLRRPGALVILAFVIVHKLGDTLSQLPVRLLFNDLHFTNAEIATYDVAFGGIAFLVGVFVGGILFARLGLKRSVLLSLLMMGVSNLAFVALARAGHSNWGMAGAIGFENFASGIGGVTVVAFLSALCDARFTATQYALLSAAASVLGRLISGTSAGALIERIGYADYYLMTVVIAFPGIALFWWMARTGMIDRAVARGGDAPYTAG